MGWLCRCPGLVWEPIRKRAHTQLVIQHSVIVISASWADVDWSWPKSPLKKKKKKKRWREMNGWTFSQNYRKRGKSHDHCSSAIQTALLYLYHLKETQSKGESCSENVQSVHILSSASVCFFGFVFFVKHIIVRHLSMSHASHPLQPIHSLTHSHFFAK